MRLDDESMRAVRAQLHAAYGAFVKDNPRSHVAWPMWLRDPRLSDQELAVAYIEWVAQVDHR